MSMLQNLTVYRKSQGRLIARIVANGAWLHRDYRHRDLHDDGPKGAPNPTGQIQLYTCIKIGDINEMVSIEYSIINNAVQAMTLVLIAHRTDICT